MSDFISTNRRCVLLDVGAGKGANFAFLPPNTDVICLEPDPLMINELERNVMNYPGLQMKDVICAYAEDMSQIETESVDFVVATYILCTVDDAKRSLAEIHRVLKKGGKYMYMEHVGAKEGTWIKAQQSLITPIWKHLFCRLDGETRDLIKETGFSRQNDEHFVLDEVAPFFSLFTVFFPSVLWSQLIGYAVK
ncbi:hypothetical protein CAPTEDRAFT_154494 [Capitella teleta]|uniref:Methyltransferase type 11 domain-containing protein n=1 Tax=Capitella teleta TaxID=283909 RepID=R7UB19_CAPTE|nr:hypothetical protein CAPTEDRAFT_154494 [Capitella teleta]|eukprot:ELU00437.1 hypothetical protein CAPTEDRAFT_154494 [Capitella teleta]